MKDKLYDPARHNEKAPAEGMAAVNTHMPEEEPIDRLADEQTNEQKEPQQKNDRAENTNKPQ